MGRLKMLLPFGDRPMLARGIECLQASRVIGRITVVTGHAEQEIRASVGEYEGVDWAHNADHAAGGMLSSVKTGVRALPGDCGAFFLVHGDQPMVFPATLDLLAYLWHPESTPIAVPSYDGKRGHPVLISCSLAAEILALGEAETLKTLMTRHARDVLEVAVLDPATVEDVDTPEDYETALQRWRNVSGNL